MQHYKVAIDMLFDRVAPFMSLQARHSGKSFAAELTLVRSNVFWLLEHSDETWQEKSAEQIVHVKGFSLLCAFFMLVGFAKVPKFAFFHEW